MAELFMYKEKNGIFHLFMCAPYSSRIDYDNGFNKNNYPLRIFNTEYGKVIVACSSTIILSQLVLSNLDLFPKKDTHIDFNFISKTYNEKINELFKNSPQIKDKPKDYKILVISENKAYTLYDNGYVKEDDIQGFSNIVGIYKGIADLYKEHDSKFMLKVVDTYKLIEKESLYPAIYVNTKDYKLKYLKGDK